jgi:hypothetical protein
MEIKLLCSIADIDNAIRISGDGNGLRLIIDIADTDVATVVTQLVGMREQSLILELKTEGHSENDNTQSGPQPGPQVSGGSAGVDDLSDEQAAKPIAKYRRAFV